MNNVLKIGTNHKVEVITILIEIIILYSYNARTVKRLLFGWDTTNLLPSFSTTMFQWTFSEEKKKYMDKFYRGKGRNQPTITSTNGALTVPKKPYGGKKPHQHKRMVAEKANKRWPSWKKTLVGIDSYWELWLC